MSGILKNFLFFSACLIIILMKSQSGWCGTIFQNTGVSSSPNPVGSGARAIGMGGAFIAIADDATAASWNPAGLIQLERPEISMVGAFLQTNEAFASDVHPETENSNRIYDRNINYLSASYPFTFYKNMVVSINYQRLYEFDREFQHPLFMNDLSLEYCQDKTFIQNGNLSALGLAGAVELTPTLSAGVTVNVWTDELFWRNGWNAFYAEKGFGKLSGVPFRTDVLIEEKYSGFRGINFNIGFLWHMTDQLFLGFVAKTPFSADVKHEYDYTQKQTFDFEEEPFEISNEHYIQENAEIHMPLSYGIGISWRVSDVFSAALDLYRTHWEEYLLEDSRGSRFSPVDGRPESESDIENTVQFRLGSEYLFIRPRTVIPVRIGIFYDPEPSEGSLKDYYGVSFGSGIVCQSLIFDFAYQFRWGKNVDTGNLILDSDGNIYQNQILASLIIHF